jgi:hypothetical protein
VKVTISTVLYNDQEFHCRINKEVRKIGTSKKIFKSFKNFKGEHLLLFRPLVQAPNRFTTLRCLPRCTIIFSSEARALIIALSAVLLTIFTATGVTVSPSIIP